MVDLVPVDGNPFAASPPPFDPDDPAFKDATDYASGLGSAQSNGSQTPLGFGTLGDPAASLPLTHPTFEKAMPYGNLQEAQDTSQNWPTRIVAGLGYEAASKLGGLGQAAWNAATLPGDVAQGRVDPNSDEAIQRSTDLAGMLTSRVSAGTVAEPSTLGISGANANSDWMHDFGAPVQQTQDMEDILYSIPSSRNSSITLTPVEGNPFGSVAANPQAWPQRFGPDENPYVRNRDGIFNLQDYNSPGFPEQIVMPAVHAPDGTLYTGADRNEYMQNAMNLGGFQPQVLDNRILNDPGSLGYITSRGRFVGIDEGKSIDEITERRRLNQLRAIMSGTYTPSAVSPTPTPAAPDSAFSSPSSSWQDFLAKNNMTEQDFGDAMLGKYGRKPNGQSNYDINTHSSGGQELASPIYDPDTGDKIGNTERVINPNTNSAYHAYLRLNADAQGSDVAKELLARQIQNYKNWGINKVGIYAGLDVGGYAWSKYGFVPKGNEINSIVSSSQNRLQSLYNSGALDDVAFADAKSAINSAANNPKGIWDISDINTPLASAYRPNPKTDTVGKYLLQGQSWPGELDLKDPEIMDRFNSYVSRKKKP